ncbi:MAG: hypothetical protein KDA42_12130 [Planctomycetales bacterium]|nr:hypothetical protein [Planctomycetales bacterium]
MRQLVNRWTLLVGANVLFCCVLSFYRHGNAAPPAVTGQPFANSITQRKEIVDELREIKALMREQNTLLKSGKIRVVVSPE